MWPVWLNAQAHNSFMLLINLLSQAGCICWGTLVCGARDERGRNGGGKETSVPVIHRNLPLNLRSLSHTPATPSE